MNRSASPADAARLLADLPLDRLPRLLWLMTEDGTLIANPPADLTGVQANIAFHLWAARLCLVPTVRRSCMAVRLRAQGVVDGILVTIWGTYPISERYRT